MQYPRQLLGIVMYWSIFLIISCTLGSYARTPRQSGRQRGRVGARSIDLLDSTHVTKVCARKQARFDWSFNLSLSGSTSRAQGTYAGREIVPVSELALFSFLSIGRFFGTIWAPATKSYQKIVPPQNSFIYWQTGPNLANMPRWRSHFLWEPRDTLKKTCSKLAPPSWHIERMVRHGFC
jgi:hypothetical protein